MYRSTGALREDPYHQTTDTPAGTFPPLSETTDAVFRGPPGYNDRLEKSGGRYILETPNGIRFEYGTHLHVERITDSNGNVMRFEYDGLRLVRVIDSVGKKFSFRYDSLDRIVVLRDETGGRDIVYFYDDQGDLVEVDLVVPGLTAGTDYRYMGPSYPFELQHSLTAIISPRGEYVVENQYGVDRGTLEFNRVIRQRSNDGEFAYEYERIIALEVDPSLDPANLAASVTRVRYPNGHVVEHRFNRQGNVLQRMEWVGTARGTGVKI